MRRLLLAFLLVLTLCAAQARAASPGFSLEGSQGRGRIAEIFDHSTSVDPATGFGLSLVIDTAPTLRNNFSYRMGLGGQGLLLDMDDGSYYKAAGIGFQNFFRFRLGGTEGWRLWMGPELGLGHLWGSTSNQDEEEDDQKELWSMDAAACLGLDIRLGESSNYISTTLGYRRMFFIDDYADVANLHMGFLNVAFIFGGAR